MAKYITLVTGYSLVNLSLDVAVTNTTRDVKKQNKKLNNQKNKNKT